MFRASTYFNKKMYFTVNTFFLKMQKTLLW